MHLAHLWRKFRQRFARASDQLGRVIARVVRVWETSRPKAPPSDPTTLAKDGYERLPIVHACIREIATSAAEPELVAERNGEPVASTDLLAELVAQPNRELTPYAFTERVVTDLYGIYGNAVIHKLRSKAGIVRELWPLRMDRLELDLNADGSIKFYNYGEAGTKPFEIPPEDIIHFKLYHPRDDYWGLSPLTVLALEGDLDHAAMSYLHDYFANGALPSAILTSAQELSEEQATVIREQWHARHGPQNGRARTGTHYDIAVLGKGTEFEPISGDPSKLELDSVLSETEARVCSVFGVPAMLVGVRVGLEQTSAYGTAREARRSFWHETLRPLYARLSQGLTLCLAPDFGPGYKLRYDLSKVDALQEDKASTRQLASVGFSQSYIARDEVRALWNLPDVDGGRKVFKVDIDVDKALAISAGTKERQAIPATVVTPLALPPPSEPVEVPEERTEEAVA